MEQQVQTKVRPAEAAAILGISRTTLKARVRSGEIGQENLGHRTKFFYRAELEAYLKRHQSNFHVKI